MDQRQSCKEKLMKRVERLNMNLMCVPRTLTLVQKQLPIGLSSLQVRSLKKNIRIWKENQAKVRPGLVSLSKSVKISTHFSLLPRFMLSISMKQKMRRKKMKDSKKQLSRSSKMIIRTGKNGMMSKQLNTRKKRRLV